MKNMGQYIAQAPSRLRTRVQGNLVAAADEWDKVKDQVLGVQGSPGNHAPPGTPPYMQTGRLRKQTRAVAAASKLVISILTTQVGAWQQDGTSRMLPHQFLERINMLARPAMLAALRKPPKTSVYH